MTLLLGSLVYFVGCVLLFFGIALLVDWLPWNRGRRDE